MYFRAGIFACVLAVTLITCQKKVPGPPPRYAILRFENLSGDSSLDWTGRAASEALSVSLAGAMDGPVLSTQALGRLTSALGTRPAAAPGISTEHANALLAGATRAITGYIDRTSGQFRITAVDEDLATGRAVRTLTASDASPMAALTRLTREFSPRARPLPTSNPAALQNYSVAFESSGPASTGLLEQTVGLDPHFGAAWVTLAVHHFAQGDRAGAAAVIERARGQKLDEISTANLDLESATFNGDQPRRIEALRRVSKLSPGDTVLLRSLAEAETTAGQFAAAASDWQLVTATMPNDFVAWNSLGYARSYAGDYAGALAALRTYQGLRPKDANPSDSIGDLNYSFRKFSDAAASYLEAHAKQPGFEQYSDLYKAAWAKFNAGDKPGAEALFAQFRTAREKQTDGAMPLLAADWLYRTGRKTEGVQALRKAVAETKSPGLRLNGLSQLVVWDLLQGNRAQAAQDSAAIGKSTTTATILIARFAAFPSASAEEWRTRADRTIPPAMGALRELALAYALLLDGKRQDAQPVWEQISRKSPATDFFTHGLYARLRGKPLERPLLPDPRNYNQFLALADSL